MSQSNLNLKRRHFTFYPEVENTSVIQIISFSRDLLLACCRYILIKGSASRYQMLSKASNNIIQNLFASSFFTVEDETSLFKDDVHHSIEVVAPPLLSKRQAEPQLTLPILMDISLIVLPCLP